MTYGYFISIDHDTHQLSYQRNEYFNLSDLQFHLPEHKVFKKITIPFVILT